LTNHPGNAIIIPEVKKERKKEMYQTAIAAALVIIFAVAIAAIYLNNL
jgi:hypothetical protein